MRARARALAMSLASTCLELLLLSISTPRNSTYVVAPANRSDMHTVQQLNFTFAHTNCHGVRDLQCLENYNVFERLTRGHQVQTSLELTSDEKDRCPQSVQRARSF